MSQVLILQIDYEIIQKFGSHRIGEDITIKLFRKSVYVLNNSIIYCGVMCRLSSGSLFKYFACKTCKVYTFKRFLLTKVINIVLAYLDGRDLGKCM